MERSGLSGGRIFFVFSNHRTIIGRHSPISNSRHVLPELPITLLDDDVVFRQDTSVSFIARRFRDISIGCGRGWILPCAKIC